MTRRSFFRLLGLAAVTAPATAALVPEKLAAVRHWWVPTAWWSKEFDWGAKLGIAGAFRNVLTGETIRNAVRMSIADATAALRVGRPDWYPGLLQAHEVRGRAWLTAWAEDLPAWRRPARRAEGHFDDVLEGREMRA